MTRDKAEELVTDLIYEYDAWNEAPSYLRKSYREDYMRFRELVISHLTECDVVNIEGGA